MNKFAIYLFASILCPLASLTAVADSGKLSCAQGSVLAALVDRGLEVNTPDLIAAFPEDHRLSDSATPMNVVCDVLKSFGLTASPVQFDISSNASQWERCILLFDAESEVPGHFVFLKSVAKNQATIVDPRHSTAEHVLTLDQMSGYWTGHAVVIGSRGLSSPMWYLTPVLVALVAALAYSEYGTRRVASIMSATIILLLCTLGCSFSSQQPTRIIEFEERSVLLAGLKEGQSLRLVLPLLIHESVRLKTLTASCSCAQFEQDLEGKVFSPGQVCEIDVSVDPGLKQEVGFDVFVETESGATSRVNVAGIVEQNPRVANEVIVSTYVVGVDTSISGQLLFVRTKPQGTPQICEDLIYVSTDEGRLQLELVECTEEQIRYSRAGQHVLREKCLWNWKVASDDNGRFSTEKLLFRYGVYELPVRLRFEEVPPIAGLTRQVYCGKLHPGTIWGRTFDLNSEHSEHFVVQFGGESGLTAKIGSITDGRQELVVSLHAPSEVGKFRLEGLIQIAGLPVPYVITFFGEVESSDVRPNMQGESHTAETAG